MKIVAAIILLILAAVMLYLGISNDMMPPTLTGVGFIVIGAVFLMDRK